MSRSAGTGQPLWWKCSVCRRAGLQYTSKEPTGNARVSRTGNAHGRSLPFLIEYRCTCGHVGWSRHIDACCAFLRRFRDVDLAGRNQRVRVKMLDDQRLKGTG